MSSNWRLSIFNWFKANKGKLIVFLAIVTTTVLLLLVQYGVMMLNADDLKQASANYETTGQMNKLLLSVVVMEMLSKFFIGLIAVYSAFLGVHFIQYDLRNKLQESRENK